MTRIEEIGARAEDGHTLSGRWQGDVFYLLAQLKEAREKLEAVEALIGDWEVGVMDTHFAGGPAAVLREIKCILHPEEGE